jgi:hypothetical protein
MASTWTSNEGTLKIGRFNVTSYADKRVCGNWTHTDSRYVSVIENKGNKTIDHGQHYTEFRGDYELRILAQLGLIPTHSDLKDLRVNPYHDLRQLKDRNGCKVYRRTFLGEFVDYAVKRQGTTYHAKTITSAIAGLELKLESKANEKARIEALANKGQLVTIGTVHDLGFCDAGIDLFLHESGLKRSGKYSAQDILEALENAPNTRGTFPTECKTIKALCHRMIVGSNCA